MSINFPTLNCRYIGTHAPDVANQEDSKSEESDGIDSNENEEKHQLRWGGAEILKFQ